MMKWMKGRTASIHVQRGLPHFWPCSGSSSATASARTLRRHDLGRSAGVVRVDFEVIFLEVPGWFVQQMNGRIPRACKGRGHRAAEVLRDVRRWTDGLRAATHLAAGQARERYSGARIGPRRGSRTSSMIGDGQSDGVDLVAGRGSVRRFHRTQMGWMRRPLRDRWQPGRCRLSNRSADGYGRGLAQDRQVTELNLRHSGLQFQFAPGLFPSGAAVARQTCSGRSVGHRRPQVRMQPSLHALRFARDRLAVG